MSSFLVLLLWSVFQVTLVALATAGAYLLARRRGASLRSTLVLTGLLTATLLIPLLWLPWPRWELPRATEVNAKHEPTIDDVSKNARSNAPPSTTITSSNDQSKNIEIEPVTWRTHWNNFVEALDAPQSPTSPISPTYRSPASPGPNLWPVLISMIVFPGLFIGLTRLAGGYWSLRRTIRAARPLRDGQLLEQIDRIRTELGMRSTVALRETHKTATAATTGWRKPVILLPIAWRNWTSEQTRAVLSHELAHVIRRDSLTGGLAQLASALHFYHPLWPIASGKIFIIS